MEKTLQQQYLLINEGKGNKEHFLKQARYLFPQFITPNNDYNTTVHILKSKSILSEGVGGVITSNPNKPDWFKIFNTNLKEAVGVKNTKEYGDQNEFEKIEKEVQDKLDHNFDNKDDKNIDNVYGQSFLMGYYTEMKDPKNADKTVDELKAIVLKNMSKDINYYHTETSFGVKGIGYTKDVVGGGDAVAPKGKYKSSGYGDMPKAKVIKEGKDEDKIARYEKYTYTLDGKKVTPDDIAFYNNILGAELDGEVYKMGIPDENGNVELNTSKGKTGIYTESKHGDEADIKIYKSELNLINKTKASGEKQLKRKADLERKIADLEKKQTESLNESKESMDFSSKDQKDWSEQKSKMYDVWANKSNELVDLKDDLKKAKNRNDKDEVKRINNKILQKQIAIKTAKEKFQKLSESLNEAKKSNVHTRIKDLEKQNEVLALESKITALEEAINELTQKVSLSESDDLAEMMDPKKINELKKDIKVLEKYKMTCEKKLSKLGGKKTIVDENKDEDYGGLNPEDYDLMDDGSMVDPETGKVVWSPTNEEINENESENENPPNKYIFVDKKVVRRISPQNGDKSYDIQFDDRTEKTIYASHDDWDKINSIYQKAKNG